MRRHVAVDHRERAADEHVTARQLPERVHATVHALADRRPGAAVPSREAIGVRAADRREEWSHRNVRPILRIFFCTDVGFSPVTRPADACGYGETGSPHSGDQF